MNDDRGATRREMLRLCGAAGLTVVGGTWLAACSSSSSTSSGTTVAPPTTAPFAGYGSLGPVDANGLRVPEGFTSRVIATSNQLVGDTGYTWPWFPDGGATFATDDGGWIYVANSEMPNNGGGVSMVRFDPTGTIVEAKAIATGTSRNCAGGATPWDTWLTCEEVPVGLVHECDPSGTRPATPLPGLGTFNHEAAAVDPSAQTVYLTEDEAGGGFYRFVPTGYPDLTTGTLEVMTEVDGQIGWAPVPDPTAQSAPTRQQVPTMKPFANGEGLCYSDGSLFFTTKGDNRVWEYDPVANTVDVVYDASATGSPTLRGVDNVTATPTGDLYVAEDGDDMQIVMVSGDTVEAVVQVTDAPESEITGPAFSPDGTRLYFSSQRSPGRTYEVTGPWRFA
jgi:hypothetical protein